MGGVGHRLAVDLLALGEQLAEGRVGLAFRRRAALAAERRARGEGLDAAAVGAVALAAAARPSRSPCGRARRRHRSRRGRSRRRGSGRRRSRCRSSASPRSAAPRAAPKRCSASAATLASLSTKAGSPVRSTTMSRIGRSSIGRLTAATATPLLVVDRRRDPQPDRLDPGRAARASLDLAHQQLDQLAPRPGRPSASRLSQRSRSRRRGRRAASSSRPDRRRSLRPGSWRQGLYRGRPRASA